MPLRSALVCSRVFHLFVVFSILFPGSIFSAVVTLESLEIFTTHEWLKAKPTVYFQCKGENKTVLPDVKKAKVYLTFKGEESWQPLTEFPSTKCKRCGFYEADILKSDEFDEWEFCPSDFNSDGRYSHFKEKEINATFLCQECVPHESRSNSSSSSSGPAHSEKDVVILAVVVTVSVVVSVLVIVGLVAAFKYWQRRKRQQEQARFLKLFEESDDIEDELGLGPLSGII